MCLPPCRLLLLLLLGGGAVLLALRVLEVNRGVVVVVVLVELVNVDGKGLVLALEGRDGVSEDVINNGVAKAVGVTLLGEVEEERAVVALAVLATRVEGSEVLALLPVDLGRLNVSSSSGYV
jgi:hypothetical protein